MRTTDETSLVIGVVLVLVGTLLLLLSNLELATIEGRVLWVMVLAASAAAFAVLYARQPGRWWALLLACIFGLMAAQRLFLWTAYEQWWCLWQLCLVAAGVALVVTSVAHPLQGGWLISGGVLLSIGLTSLLATFELVPGNYQAVVFFAGLGWTFASPYFLRNEQRHLAWAKYPALSLLGLAALIFVCGTAGARRLLLPLLLLALGAGVAWRGLTRARRGTDPEKGQESP